MAKTLMSVALFYLNVLAMSYCYIPGLEGWSAFDQSLLADVRVLKYAAQNPIEYHSVPYITLPSTLGQHQETAAYPHFEVSHQEILAANNHEEAQEYSEELHQEHGVHQLDHEGHGHYQKHEAIGHQHEAINHHHQQQEEPQDHQQEEHQDHHHKKNVHYKFAYAVNDHKTGDVKSHSEERKGDEVRGQYSVMEEDGNVRTVKYYADWKTGFHAQVHNSKPR